MSILALDACGRYAIAALQRGGGTLYASSSGGEGAVRAVYSSVDRVLQEGDAKPAELDAIVVNTGPGSWTGARVAVTYCASLAFAADIPVFGFCGFAIGKRLAESVGFIDQLGKTVSETEQPARIIELFPDLAADAYLTQRSVWLDQMLQLAAEALESGASGYPLSLQTTYFQEFLTGART